MWVVCVRLLFLGAFFLSGCADPNTTPQQLQFGDNKTLVLGPNVRLVTERDRPLPGDGNLPAACTEPSPDVAIAFGRSLAASGSYSQPSGPTVSGSVNAVTTENATALGGRTAGVLALRDGLYAACQAYTNGVLGHDAYAIILSQYGNLLVALTGSGPATATAYSQQDAALAALLVSCISEYDPTRLGALNPDGSRATNPLLSRRLCGGVLSNLAQGKLLTIPKATAKKKTAAATSEAPDKTTASPTTITTEKVSSTKTTTMSGSGLKN